jgi:2-methylcitrate dehydratase PrpD
VSALRAEPAGRGRYLAAMGDWLACAVAGAGERAPQALLGMGDGLLDAVAFAGAAGHVLDYDDTLPDGIAHVSAATAPAALVVGASLGVSLGEVVDAFAEGWEAMAAVACASHPALYDGGWHPTAVCGPIGAVVASGRLLGLDAEQHTNALALALLRAGGARGAFGSDGKAIQVGLAAAAGVQAALLARAGARAEFSRAVEGLFGWASVTGSRFVAPSGGAIERNWVKLHPSCLGTHSAIDAALGLAFDEGVFEVVVDPSSRAAAHLDAVHDPLEGKFSIPYCVAFTLVRGRAPRVRDFESLDSAVVRAARRVGVVVDDAMSPWSAVLRRGGRELARVPCPRGTPERPATAEELRAKIVDLAGAPLLDLLTDFDAPAADVLERSLAPKSVMKDFLAKVRGGGVAVAAR